MQRFSLFDLPQEKQDLISSIINFGCLSLMSRQTTFCNFICFCTEDFPSVLGRIAQFINCFSKVVTNKLNFNCCLWILTDKVTNLIQIANQQINFKLFFWKFTEKIKIRNAILQDGNITTMVNSPVFNNHFC